MNLEKSDFVTLISEPYETEIKIFKNPESYTDNDVKLIFADKSFTKKVPSKNESALNMIYIPM